MDTSVSVEETDHEADNMEQLYQMKNGVIDSVCVH